MKISDVKAPDINQDNDTLTISCSININDKVSSFEDETYVYINPYQILENFKFDKKRKFDYWFTYKKNDHVEEYANCNTKQHKKNMNKNGGN